MTRQTRYLLAAIIAWPLILTTLRVLDVWTVPVWLIVSVPVLAILDALVMAWILSLIVRAWRGAGS
jgi:hypothetical protein